MRRFHSLLFPAAPAAPAAAAAAAAVAVSVSVSVAVAVCVAMAVPANAQQTVPDTLDWHGYYPLEIGNVWETTVDGAFEFEVFRKRIESDTVIDGKTWFIQTTRYEGIDHGEAVAGIDTLILRYDDPYGRVVALSLTRAMEWDYTCDLSGDFGEEVQCDAGTAEPRPILFDGGYNGSSRTLSVGGEQVPFAATKYDPFIAGPVPDAYYHGIGPLWQPGDGFFGSIYFSYLRLSGVEYGTPVSFIGVESADGNDRVSISLFPNPVSRQLTIVVGQADLPVQLQVFDLLGRVIASESCSDVRCSVNVGQLAAGVYHLNVTSRYKSAIVRQFVVL